METRKRKNASKNNPTLKKTKWLKVRLSEADYEAVHDLAAKAGLSISEIIRIRLLGDNKESVISDFR